MLGNHKAFFTEKQVSALRPGELYAYENCELYRVSEFMGSGNFKVHTTTKHFDRAVEVSGKIGRRAFIHCVAERRTGDLIEDCVCFVPVMFKDIKVQAC